MLHGVVSEDDQARFPCMCWLRSRNTQVNYRQSEGMCLTMRSMWSSLALYSQSFSADFNGRI